MKRKDYQKPKIKAITLKYRCQLLAGSLKSIKTNDDDLEFAGGSVEEAY